MTMQHNDVKENDGCRWGFCASFRTSWTEKDLVLKGNDREIFLSFEQPTAEQQMRLPSPTTVHIQSMYAPRSRSSKSSSISTKKLSFHSKPRGRPSISAPTNFRRVTEPPIPGSFPELSSFNISASQPAPPSRPNFKTVRRAGTEPLPEPIPARRRSFRPLELSVYGEPLGRLSPLPDFSTDAWESQLPGLARPKAAILRRETVDNSAIPSEAPKQPLSTYGGFIPRKAIMSEPYLLAAENGPGPVVESPVPMDFSRSDSALSGYRTPTMSAPQMDNMVPDSMVPVNNRPWSLRSSVGSSISGLRSPPSGAQHGRSGSLLSNMRRSRSATVDEAINELNTIVEEKRIKALRAASPVPGSPTSHQPAIAPNMSVRVRSETLSDIGSAFSHSANRSMGMLSNPQLMPTRAFAATQPNLTASVTSSNNSSATALPQMPANPLNANPPKQAVRKDRFSWLRRSISSLNGSTTSVNADSRQSLYKLGDNKETLIHHVPSNASLSSISTVTTMRSTREASMDSAYATSMTTLGGRTTSPTPTNFETATPRPSISKVQRKRLPKRGLSIDTTMSNTSTAATIPPAYHELGPQPMPYVMEAPITPSRIGVAC